MRNSLESWRSTRNSPLREMQAQIDHLFDEFSTWPKFSESSLTEGSLCPRCQMTEDAANYYVKFEIPGISKDQIKVELSNNILTVSAERKEEKSENGEKSHYSEFSYGSYERSMRVPHAVDDKKIQANFRDGVLSLTLPKTGEGSTPKQIAIQ